ncbi:BrnA antitoxin family protein [Yoonia litorea]|uniref:BrnA antitoxin of type II toxin-antitoxin system n=1 Tax=Yoonia litorea TaxID=1123755 RepID=A0A1I6MK94_9RHOB|nr:BrnA antitoxin family protein [Yoonia litorea]SFS16048.1 BrnA antitoxin of type II toxin-antitoxin system [Yoonia litorea]
MTKPKPMTKTERTQWGYAVDAMRRIEWDQHATLIAAGGLPAGWDDIWKTRAHRDTRTERVTIRLDADVVKFFKAMGEGYQPRINAALRAFMYFRLAGVVEGPETGTATARFFREGAEDAAAKAEEKELDFDQIRAEIGARLDRIREAQECEDDDPLRWANGQDAGW